jgi:hypothetical protein
MLPILPLAIAASLVLACALFALAVFQKNEMRRWVDAGSQSRAFAHEQAGHLHTWANHFAWWHMMQNLALLLAAVSTVLLIAYWVAATTAYQVASAGFVFARM